VNIGIWDFVLVVVVSLQCTVVAYVHAPRWKALVLTLPIPFSMATCALGEPINVTHASSLVLFMVYANTVRWLHVGARVPIVWAIVLSAGGYALVGTGLACVLPRTDAAFWVAAGVLAGAGAVLALTMPHRAEPGHRSPMPLGLKLLVVCVVIATIVVLKHSLHGFMTGFPMVGVVTAYEARHSLWTICRHVPIFMVAFSALVATAWLTQGTLGLGGALAVGWLAFLALFVPLTRLRWRADARRVGAVGDTE